MKTYQIQEWTARNDNECPLYASAISVKDYGGGYTNEDVKNIVKDKGMKKDKRFSLFYGSFKEEAYTKENASVILFAREE